MARITSLINEEAVLASKQIRELMKQRGRNAAKGCLNRHLKTVPMLNSKAHPSPTSDQVSTWRGALLEQLETLYVDYPPFIADTLDLLTKAGDFETGDALARDVLKKGGVNVGRRGDTPPDVMLSEAASWGTIETEVLLAMSDLYNQRAKASGNRANGAGGFNLAEFIIGRLTVGKNLDKALKPETTLALINGVLHLPHYHFSPEANESMLRLAAARSEQLLEQTPVGHKNGISRDDVWQARIRAGIHLASHLCANGKSAEGLAMFHDHHSLCQTARKECPNNQHIFGSHLRVLHKWYKYEADFTDIGGKSMVRNIYNMQVAHIMNAVKKHKPVNHSILSRMARFEYDAGGRSLGKALLRTAISEAVRVGSKDPWPQTVMQRWLKAERDKPKKKIKIKKIPVVKGRERKPPKRHHKPNAMPATVRHPG